jgi:acyl-CoA oxidase
LRDFVFGGYDAGLHDELTRLFASLAERNTQAGRATGPVRHRKVYADLRSAGAVLGPGSALLSQPQRLFAAEAWAAMADPALAVPMFVHYCMAVGAVAPLRRSGRSFVEEELGRLDRLETVGLILITEVGHGSSHAALRTEAVWDRSQRCFRLNTPDDSAQKFMAAVSAAGVAKTGVVYARVLTEGSDHGVFPFLVPLRDREGLKPGVRVTALPEVLGAPLDYSLVAFDQVVLPFASVLTEDLSLAPDGELVDPLGDSQERLVRSMHTAPGAWSSAATMVAAATRAAVAVSLTYAGQRRTSGRLAPGALVLEYRNQQQALLEALATAYAVTVLANETVAARGRELPGGEDVRAVPPAPPAEVSASPWVAVDRRLSLIKASVCWEGAGAIDDCVRVGGAHAQLIANRLTSYSALARLFNAGGGDSGLIAVDAARALASVDCRPVISGVVPTCPPADLLDVRGWASLARARENALQQALHGELARGPAPDAPEYFAFWNDRIPAGLELTSAHTHRLTLEAFANAISDLSDERARAAVTPLCALYALRSVREHAGWYVARRWLTPTDLDHLAGRLNGLYDLILPSVPALVEAFAIPQTILGAPMSAPGYVEALSGPGLRGGTGDMLPPCPDCEQPQEPAGHICFTIAF